MSGNRHEHGPDCAWHFEQGDEPECLDGFAYQPLRVRPCPYSASPHAHVGDCCEPGYDAGYVQPGRGPSPKIDGLPQFNSASHGDLWLMADDPEAVSDEHNGDGEVSAHLTTHDGWHDGPSHGCRACGVPA